MPNLTCPKGHTINLSPVPAPGENLYLPTTEWDSLVETVATAVKAFKGDDPTLLREAISDALASEVQYFYVCPQCGALIFPGQEPSGYVPTP
jgi:hypothetical protein